MSLDLGINISQHCSHRCWVFLSRVCFKTLEVSFTFSMGLNGSMPKGTVSKEQGARFVSNFEKRTANFAPHGVLFFIVYKPRKVALP